MTPMTNSATPMDTNDATDDCDAAKNGSGCYDLAIRELRLNLIRAGKCGARLECPDEIQAAKDGGWYVDPVPHQVMCMSARCTCFSSCE